MPPTALSRRAGLRASAQSLCNEIAEDEEQLGLLLDVSEHGLRLERPHQWTQRRCRERVVQLEFEHPAVDELIWAKGVIRFDKLEPIRKDGRVASVRRTSGVEIVSAASRHLRLLRDYVCDLRRALPEPEPMIWSTALRLG